MMHNLIEINLLCARRTKIQCGFNFTKKKNSIKTKKTHTQINQMVVEKKKKTEHEKTQH